METAILIILGLYLLQHILLFTGILLNFKKPKENESFSPFVSVIVAGRNEEKNIAGCIESLLKLTYPKDRLEIFIVNDRSTDRTGEIMLSYAKNNPVLKYIGIDKFIGNLKGKVNALAVAINSAKGEIIFTTDADIEVQPTWVEEMAGNYDDLTGVVSSFSNIKAKSLFSGIQSFDWLYLLGIAAGGDGLGQPISCVGNNMSYRKSAYDEVGGYEKIKYSITEDFMLLQSICKKTKWKSKFPVNNNIANETFPCADIKELYRQKKRWAKGGLDSHSFGMLAGAMAWLSGALVLFGWLFSVKLYLLFITIKIITDLIFIIPLVKEFRMWKTLIYLPVFEIYFAVYVFLMPFILLFDGKVVWKEQKV